MKHLTAKIAFLVLIFGLIVYHAYTNAQDGETLISFLEAYFNTPQKYFFLISIFFSIFFFFFFSPFLEPMYFVRIGNKECFSFLLKKGIILTGTFSFALYGAHIFWGILFGMSLENVSFLIVVYFLRLLLFSFAMYLLAICFYCITKQKVFAACVISLINFGMIGILYGIVYQVYFNTPPPILVNGAYSLYIGVCIFGGLFYLYQKTDTIECIIAKD